MKIMFFLPIIMSAGFLGALAQQTIAASTPPAPGEGEETPPQAPGFSGFNLVSALILGAAASLIVPLFLSIGNNDIIQKILAGTATSAASDMLVVAGFCVLAGATAPSFIDNLAKKALAVAEANKEKVKQLAAETQETKELVAEEREGRPESVDAAQRLNEARPLGGAGLDLVRLGMQSASPSEQSVVDAIAGGPYLYRSIGGISADLGMDRAKVAAALGSLVASGVLKTRKTGNGVTLFGLKTPGTD